MGLKITLKPNEQIVVNGCIIRNSNRRHALTIENRADVVRAEDLLDANTPPTPVKQAYFLIQTALTRPDTRESLVPVIQQMLADLVLIFNRNETGCVFEAASAVAVGDYYRGMSALRSLIRHEQSVLTYIAERDSAGLSEPRLTTEDAAASEGEMACGTVAELRPIATTVAPPRQVDFERVSAAAGDPRSVDAR